MKNLMESYLWGFFFFLEVLTAKCFLIHGARSTSLQTRNGGSCANRRPQPVHAPMTAPEAPPFKPRGDAGMSMLAYEAGFIASSGAHEAIIRLLATVEHQRGEWSCLKMRQGRQGRQGGESELEEGEEELSDEREAMGLMAGAGGLLDEVQGRGAYGESRIQGDVKGEDKYFVNEDENKEDNVESIDNERVEAEDYVKVGKVAEKGRKVRKVTGGGVERSEVGQKVELEAESEFQVYINQQDFFSDLVPFEEYQPTIFPDNAMCSRDELMNANLSCAENPFDLTSFYVDRDIKTGVIDKKKRKAIQPMMKVVEQVCELIDTTEDVFSFKYTGLIAHKRGIEAWTKQLIKQHYPKVKDVQLVTNRTRDRRDY